MHHNRGTILEGIEDNIVYGFCVFVALMMSLIGYLFFGRQNNDLTIHPESQQNVDHTRSTLQQQQQQNHVGVEPTAPPASELNTEIYRCPICIDEAKYTVETNCGHAFCGLCMTTYWRSGNWLGAVRCPVCRQVVTILLLKFTDEERNEDNAEKRDILQNVRDYNRRFSGEPRSLLDYLRDLPTLMRHFLREFFSIGGLILMFRVRVILCFLAALLYFVSPLDIIPEAAFGLLGFLDDFFILLLLAVYISIIYRQFVANREQQGY